MTKLFSTGEAAEYVGVSRQDIKYHVYTVKDLKPDHQVGRNLVFTQETLDDYNSRRRGPGRPRGDNYKPRRRGPSSPQEEQGSQDT